MSVASVAEQLIDDEVRYRRVKKPEARAIIAREAGIAPGSLENLARGRLKHVDRIAGHLNALLVKKLEQRFAEIEHELIFLRATPDPSREADVLGAAAALEDARRCLGKS